MQPKVSICILTMDRYWMTRYCIEHSLANCGHDNIEVLILDNGSRDGRVIYWGEQLADQYIIETENIGIAAGYNKLFRLATGDFICTISNDMLLSANWLRDMIHYNTTIPNSGITAIHCLLDKGELKDGVYQPTSGIVYSNWLWSKKLLKDIGGLNPVFYYGYDDAEYCYRAKMSGYINYYIPFHYCIHCGEDFYQDSEYRKLKDKKLKENRDIFKNNIDHFKRSGHYKIPL